MLVKTKGAALVGIDALIITIEVNVSMGQGYCLVGLPDNAVKESLHRTESAIKANGFFMPRTKLVVNLSPADIKKTGAAFDLPISIGVLAASEQLRSLQPLDQYLIMGELSLDGSLYPIKGVLAMTLQAKAAGFKGMILPIENAQEAHLVRDFPVHGFGHLSEVIVFLNDPNENNFSKNLTEKLHLLKPTHLPLVKPIPSMPPTASHPQYHEIKGQAQAKRGLVIASAGNHNMLLVGPPGAGKSMLAKSMLSILPPLSFEEAIESSKIYSAVGQVTTNQIKEMRRPFRQPHHSITAISLIGGGTQPRPGEISFAHNGVLFLDELPEFKRATIEMLRQPMEEGLVTISRAQKSLQFPARFMLIAAMNPCPCGYFNHPNIDCHCSPTAIQKYRFRISGPLLDRIDLQMEVTPVAYEALRGIRDSEVKNETQYTFRSIENARKIQIERYRDEINTFDNAQLNTSQLEKFCPINKESEILLKKAMQQFQLSARAFDRIIKVSRTIADLATSKQIEPMHIAEAIQFRNFDRGAWGQFKN